MFDVYLLACVLLIIYSIELGWWEHILLEICAFVQCVWKLNGFNLYQQKYKLRQLMEYNSKTVARFVTDVDVEK
jgi:hypothetical protein